MKIKEIKRKENSYFIYEVTFTPNWFERLFGVKEKTKEYKDSGANYTFGGGTVYLNKDGKRLGGENYETIRVVKEKQDYISNLKLYRIHCSRIINDKLN